MNQFGFVPTVPLQQNLQTLCNGQQQSNVQYFTDPNNFQTIYSSSCCPTNPSPWMTSNLDCPINSNQWLPPNMQYSVNDNHQCPPPRCQYPMDNNLWTPPNIGAGCNCLALRGEGVALPVQGADGQVKFYFIPKTNFLSPITCNCLNIPNGCQNRNTEGWLITGLLPNVQDFVKQNGFWNSNFNNFGQGMELCNIGLQPRILLFHNDVATSTTDLHYFFPNLRGSPWISPVDECVQAEIKTDFAMQCLIQNCTQTAKADQPSASMMDDDFCDCSSSDEEKTSTTRSRKRMKSCNSKEALRFFPKKKTGNKGG